MSKDQKRLGTFYTPINLALAICQMIDRDLGGPAGWVLEPSVGEGAFVRAAKALWPTCKVLGIDVDPKAPGFTLCDETIVGDFLQWNPSSFAGFDVVVGNPPFSIQVERTYGKRNPRTKWVNHEVGEAHVRKCLSLLNRGGSCDLLLRAAFVHTLGRTDLLERLDIEAKVGPRPSFTGGGSDNSEYSTFQWRNSHFAPRRRIERLTWDKPRRQRVTKTEE
jgi:hypothetical protein